MPSVSPLSVRGMASSDDIVAAFCASRTLAQLARDGQAPRVWVQPHFLRPFKSKLTRPAPQVGEKESEWGPVPRGQRGDRHQPHRLLPAIVRFI